MIKKIKKHITKTIMLYIFFGFILGRLMEFVEPGFRPLFRALLLIMMGRVNDVW